MADMLRFHDLPLILDKISAYNHAHTHKNALLVLAECDSEDEFEEEYNNDCGVRAYSRPRMTPRDERMK